MSKPRTNPSYAKLDPTHVFDGLFVPTNGKTRGRLEVPLRKFGSSQIGFDGATQLGCDDQSVLLALTAQLGIDGLRIDASPNIGPVSEQLRLSMFSKSATGDNGAVLATKRTSLRSLLLDAGYYEDTSTDKVKVCLRRLRTVQIHEIDENGWDRAHQLIAVEFNVKTGETYIAANPRLTGAVFQGQYIKVSLFERNALESEVAKVLHCWLSSNIRLGQSLGNGNGASLDTLGPHVWGTAAWDAFSAQDRSKKRGQLRGALAEIADLTRGLQKDVGWAIDTTGKGGVMISRPKALPKLDAWPLSPSRFKEMVATVDIDRLDPPEDFADWRAD